MSDSTLNISDYDVIIRCRNEIEWLPRVINSLRNQTIPPENIIFVDNDSTDGSKEFALDAGCILIPYDLNRFNYSYALNLGIKHSNRKYILILSAHCELFNKNAIEIMLKNFEQDNNVVGVYGRQIPTMNSNSIDTRDLLTVFGREKIVFRTSPFFHNAFSMIDRKAWESLNFDENVNGIEDRVWAIHQAKFGKKIIYEPDALAYHEHGLNQGSTLDRAERVCAALKVLHKDDIFEWPKFS